MPSTRSGRKWPAWLTGLATAVAVGVGRMVIRSSDQSQGALQGRDSLSTIGFFSTRADFEARRELWDLPRKRNHLALLDPHTLRDIGVASDGLALAPRRRLQDAPRTPGRTGSAAHGRVPEHDRTFPYPKALPVIRSFPNPGR